MKRSKKRPGHGGKGKMKQITLDLSPSTYTYLSQIAVNNGTTPYMIAKSLLMQGLALVATNSKEKEKEAAKRSSAQAEGNETRTKDPKGP